MIKLKKNPLVSVVMPAYNAEKYIQESIESVLQQTYKNFELIIINDGSKDHTERIIDSFTDDRIIYINNGINRGVAYSLNCGLSKANGKYIMRLDSDDIAYPYRMETQVKYFEEHSDVYVLGTGMRAFGDGIYEYDMIPACHQEQLKIDSLFFCPISHPSVMFRKELVDKGFIYDPEYERIEDYELWVRIMRKYSIRAIPDILVRYRIHEKQVTQEKSDEINSTVVRLHERQMNEMSVIFAEDEFDGISYTRKASDMKEVLKKINVFSKMLNSSNFITYYNKKMCEEHFYMIIRNEILTLPYDKKKKEKLLFIIGKNWKISKERVLLDCIRVLWH